MPMGTPTEIWHSAQEKAQYLAQASYRCWPSAAAQTQQTPPLLNTETQLQICYRYPSTQPLGNIGNRVPT